MGWNIGANDTANCIGTTVGCGLISFRKGVVLVAFFAILGSLMEGSQVMNTVGTGIVKEELTPVAVIITLICSGFFVTLATVFKLPVSTAQSIVGGVVGIGLGVQADIDYSRLVSIAESWVICPLLVMALAFILSHLLAFIIPKLKFSPMLIQNTLGWMAILSSCYVAYSLGANNTGVAVGPIFNLGIVHPTILLGIGGCTIALGAATYGRNVAYTVGKGITPLDISGALAAQVASAFGLHLFSMLGIPVSSSSAIVGAVVGVGLVNGVNSISRRTILPILMGWVLTPTCAACSSFLVYRLVTVLAR